MRDQVSREQARDKGEEKVQTLFMTTYKEVLGAWLHIEHVFLLTSVNVRCNGAVARLHVLDTLGRMLKCAEWKQNSWGHLTSGTAATIFSISHVSTKVLAFSLFQQISTVALVRYGGVSQFSPRRFQTRVKKLSVKFKISDEFYSHCREFLVKFELAFTQVSNRLGWIQVTFIV